jgi:hypothetical protein
METNMSLSSKLFVATLGLLVSWSCKADLASDIAQASDAQILIAGKKMAEALARTAPSQIDGTTILRGGIFFPDTKTVIYKYDSSIALDPKKMNSYIGRQMCADPVKLAFMKRGVRYRHDYTTPLGLQSVVITHKDC